MIFLLNSYFLQEFNFNFCSFKELFQDIYLLFQALRLFYFYTKMFAILNHQQTSIIHQLLILEDCFLKIISSFFNKLLLISSSPPKFISSFFFNCQIFFPNLLTHLLSSLFILLDNFFDFQLSGLLIVYPIIFELSLSSFYIIFRNFFFILQFFLIIFRHFINLFLSAN